MIDYDKLKIAIELSDKLAKKNGHMVYLQTFLTFESLVSNTFTLQWSVDDQEVFHNIDDLITKLRELTQPEPNYKYPLASIVYFLDGGSINVAYVISFNTDRYILDYEGDTYYRKESELYTTKSQLIAAQIEYWSKLKSDYAPLPVSTGGRAYEPEYCNVSGAKLGKREECDHPDKTKQWIFGYGWEFRHCDKCDSDQWQANTAIGVSCFSPNECQHESDGLCYTSYPPQNKCIKCGEFYR